jgi:hypothetical protein
MIRDVDEVLRERTVAALEKHEGRIKDRIVAEAKAQGHKISAGDVTAIRFKKFVNLKQTTDRTFGKFVTTGNVRQPLAVNIAVANNNSAGTMTVTFSYDDTEKQSFSWSITEGVTLSETIKESVGVPGLSSELGLTLQMSVSATQGSAYETTKHWGAAIAQEIPAYHAVTFQAILERVKGELPFEIVVHKSGKAHCQTTVQFFRTHDREFDVDLADLLGNDERTFRIKGTVTGVCGVKVSPDAQDAPLDDGQKAALPPGQSTVSGTLGTIVV